MDKESQEGGKGSRGQPTAYSGKNDRPDRGLRGLEQ